MPFPRHLRLLIIATCLWLAWPLKPAEAQSRLLTGDDDAGPSQREYRLGAGQQLQWNPAWPKFSTWNYVLTATATVSAIAAVGLARGSNSPSVTELTFDERARALLLADSRRNRLLARDMSDVLVTVLASYPVMGDALLNATWYRDSPQVGGQLALIYFETTAVTAAVAALSKAAISRQRPFGRRCGNGLPEDTWDCVNRDRYFSHFSGHASASFNAASVSCVYHHYLPLFGGGSRWVPCAVGYSLAATTATLRVVSDQHYASDVIVGAAIGTTIGLLVPWLHFRRGEPTSLASERTVIIAPAVNGIVASGVF